jgi:hypothetical protein
MKRVVFPILVLLCTALGCPAPGAAGAGSTIPGKCPASCELPVGAAKAAMPVSTVWRGERLQRPATPAGRAFIYLATDEATVYSVVIVDGGAVTARFDLNPDSLQTFITQSAATDDGPKRSSPTVKVGGPPRPLHFVVPTPPRASDPAYWAQLACLDADADARATSAASGRATTTASR